MMKTTTRKLLLLAVMIGMVSTSSFGQIATPPTIDGDGSDAVWATATAADLLRDYPDSYSGVTGDDDLSGTVKTLWDADNFYVLVEVTDDSLNVEADWNPWERDHYTIYLDLNNRKTLSYVKDNDDVKDSVMFNVEKVWTEAKALAMYDTALVEGTDYAEVIGETGYTVEFAFPLSKMGVTMAADQVIGFDVKIGDNDGEGRDGMYSLYQMMDEGWRNPSYLGTSVLNADGSSSQMMHSVTLDGVDDYEWYGATTYQLATDNNAASGGSAIDNAADFSGNVKTLWDAENFYVLLTVKDDTLITDLDEEWNRDHYSVYFDMDNHKTTSYIKDSAEPMDSVQFMLEKIWSTVGDINFSNRVANLDSSLVQGMDFVEMIDSGKGYTLEIALPLDVLGVTLGEGDIIGFDAKIGDNDGVAGREATLSWHQRLDEGWQNPSYLGNVELMAGALAFDMGTTMDAGPQIEIDGEVDGGWSNALAMPLERENDATGITDAADFSGVAKALWDKDNFYVLLDVKDDSLNIDASWNPWERDHYTIYFDLDNLKTETYVSASVNQADSIQFNVEKVWSEAKALTMNDTALVEGVDYVEIIGDDGYILEFAFPFHKLGADLSAYEDEMIGFDVKIGDNDGDGRDATLSWNQLMDEGWRNPSYLGEVTLLANGTVFGTPEIEPLAVTFNVDMSGMIAEGIIDPAVDMVDIAGTLNGWGDPVMNLSDVDADGIYTITPDTLFLPGDMLEYKIRVNGSWDPISEFPGGGPNRSYTVVEGDNVVDIVFNDGDYTPWIDDAVEVDRASLIQIYPNPASSTLNIKNVEEISTIELVNLLGQVTYRQLNSGNSSTVMSLDGQASGVYMIRFTDMDNNISMKKLIIE